MTQGRKRETRRREIGARERVAGLALALGFGLGAVACGPADDAAPASATRIRGPGHVLYLTYCQGCHGESGRGDGAAAASLRTPPTDLTRLWERYGTPLDRERLGRYIDGRRLLGGHDPREMPIWGEEFFADVPPTTPNLESAKHRLIEVLVDYVETLQTERGA